MKQQHLKTYLKNAKNRALRENVPFNITLQHLIDIATDECPIFHTPFVWGSSGLGKGKVRENTPQLDKIIPQLGYVKGNIAFLSGKANKMKDNGTMQDHYDIADWIWNHTHANKRSTTSLPTGSNITSEADFKRRAVFATRLGEDRNYPDNHSGAIPGQDADYSTQESSGDSVGHGVQEMEALIIAQSIEATWPSEPKVIFIRDRSGHLPD